jgi:hypothetical protein
MNENDEREQEPVLGDLELANENFATQQSEDSIEAQVSGTNGGDAAINRERAVSRARRPRVHRSFPAAPSKEALELPLAIQRLAAGTRIRRIRLFELLERSPESGPSRQLITNSARYGLTTGSHSSEWLELTDDGRIATADNVPEREKNRARFKVAIEQISPFNKLHARFVNNRLPAQSVMQTS